jgi:membrane protein implicated in regulation of membrane protease activity
VSALLRYTLLQLPALAFVGLAAVLLWRMAGLPGWAAAAIVAVWAAKDVAMYPFVRGAYAGPGGPGTSRFVGQHGIARQDLAPRGYVAIGSELWRAELAPGAARIGAGKPVRVVGARRLTLIVVPGADDD